MGCILVHEKLRILFIKSKIQENIVIILRFIDYLQFLLHLLDVYMFVEN
jgi:hypothetical protein